MVKTPCFHCRGAQVQSPVGELRSCMPHSMAKKIKILKKILKKKVTSKISLQKKLPWDSGTGWGNGQKQEV